VVNFIGIGVQLVFCQLLLQSSVPEVAGAQEPVRDGLFVKQGHILYFGVFRFPFESVTIQTTYSCIPQVAKLATHNSCVFCSIAYSFNFIVYGTLSRH
jgi:hypothetical protein